MDKTIPTINFRYFMEHDAESTEDEELLPVPSTLSDDSNPSVHSISAVELAVPSTSMVLPEIMVDIPPPVPSARVIDLTSPIPSMSTMPPIFSIEMPPVPSTSRDVQEYYDDFRFEAARRSSFRNWPVSFIDPFISVLQLQNSIILETLMSLDALNVNWWQVSGQWLIFPCKFMRCVLQSADLSAMNIVIMYQSEQILLKFDGQNEKIEIYLVLMVYNIRRHLILMTIDF
jgi:hypothetical protein